MRLRFNFRDGQIQAINAASNTLVSAGFADFPTVQSPDHIHVILDPTKEHGEPEMVYIVGHVAGSSSVTVQRGKDGTSARAHPEDTIWVHGVVASDFEELTGPQGPEGPPGPDFRYIHDQPIASAVWTINHNLNGFPNVTVIDSANEIVEGHIVYTSGNTIRLEFTGGFSGKAYLS